MIRTCTSCGQKNRVPVERLSQQAKCGGCKKPLGAVGETIDAGSEDFDELINGSNVPVVVDFWAPWCGPCRMAGGVGHLKRKKRAIAG